MMSSQVAVVTVNWNGWQNTLDCLAALRSTQVVTWRLIIVDNASTDQSVERLCGLGADVILIESPVNGGWTGGNNLGVAKALQDGYEYIFLLNNDAFVEPDTLAELVAGASRAPHAILGGVLRSVEDGSEMQSGFAINPKTGLPRWSHTSKMTRIGDGLLAASTVCGAALFAPRGVFEAIGPFDDDFYLYADESDWCLRAAKAGYPSVIVERATVRHLAYASSGGDTAPLVTYFATRNALLLTERHGNSVQRLRVAKQLLSRALKESGLTARARWRGIADYLTRRFGDCPLVVRSMQNEWRSKSAP